MGSLKRWDGVLSIIDVIKGVDIVPKDLMKNLPSMLSAHDLKRKLFFFSLKIWSGVIQSCSRRSSAFKWGIDEIVMNIEHLDWDLSSQWANI